MRIQQNLGAAFSMALVVLALGCGGTMSTGTAKRPVNNKPAADGTCPSGRSLCGTGVFAICVDLQNDPNHCGTCDHVCSAGIACQAGTCAQTVCASTIAFSGQPTASPAASPYSSVWGRQILADVNGDGNLDLVDWLAVASIDPHNPDLTEFHVSLGQPGGGFGPPETYHASSWVDDIFVMDVNSDGLDDLYVFASTLGDGKYPAYRVELWLGQSDGQLVRYDAGGVRGNTISAQGSAMGDLSGDGWPDMVVLAPDTGDTPTINVFLSDSTGALHWSASYVTAGWVMHTFIRDWDGNGSPDLVVITGFNKVQIFYNRGDGSFEPGVDCGLAVPAWGQDGAVLDDFNHDGHMDMAVCTAYERVTVLLGTGGCGFEANTDYVVPGVLTPSLRALDVNGDGQLDLLSITAVSGPDPSDPNGLGAVTTDNLLAVLLGKPDGSFVLQDQVLSLGAGVSDVAVGEVTGDGRPDIIVTSGDGQTQTWENACQ